MDQHDRGTIGARRAEVEDVDAVLPDGHKAPGRRVRLAMRFAAMAVTSAPMPASSASPQTRKMRMMSRARTHKLRSGRRQVSRPGSRYPGRRLFGQRLDLIGDA